uniref:SLC26A/SulP transporter domain-containing protein n=1 Tax=Acrobeloides nanus TaxID=290746 RepID=A0A914E0D1_9BILA
MHVPQGIAYAVVSGVHPIIGLYTSFFPALFYMVLGTSKHCSIGSFAVVALMTSVAVSKIQAEYGDISTAVEFNNTNAQNVPYVPSAESITTVLTLCVGLFQIIMGILHLEIIITYFSDQVVDGFTTAASFYVLATQLREFFGLPNLPRRTGAGNLFLRFYDVAVSIVNINWATTVISVTSVAFLIIGKDHITPYVKRKTKIPITIPFELILIIIVTIISSLFKFNSNMSVKIVNKLPIGMPSPHVPDISLISKAFPNAIAISIVVFAVHISMAKMDAKSEE